jgi:hypothetical protein
MSRAEAPPSPLPLPQLRSFAETKRTDAWWIQPLLVFLGFSAFIVYSTWAGLQGQDYFLEGTRYLSPMYSPLLFESWKAGTGMVFNAAGELIVNPAVSGHALFGAWPTWLPHSLLIPLTPAVLILWIPGGFRFTCYYYRGAYYKAFWQDPTSCAVGEPAFRKEKYRGEEKWPLLIQNIHRYFLYLAIIFVFLLTYDGIQSFFFPSGTRAPDGTWLTEPHWKFGVGVGSLVLMANPIFIALYTFGCHSYRHLIGGRKDHLSELGPRKKVYDCVSCLNRRHMMWAWISLFWVGFTDAYVRLCSMGIWHDYRII